MTKLPERNILDGSKLPKTTTGEMKGALGKIRDYLFELFGDDSADKEAARLSLGIDLDGLNGRLSGKAERTELEQLQDEIGKRGVPIGSIDYFATETPPAGYLKADGSAVGRETYPDLFTAIGTTFGEGDGSTTFNLPDLMGRFAEGSHLPGTKKEAGLPNITGNVTLIAYTANTRDAFFNTYINQTNAQMYESTQDGFKDTGIGFNASRSNSIYGAADTVQPRALTLLPCIKAFNAVIHLGSIDVAQLAQDVSGKLDRNVNGKPARYVIDAYEDGSHWWRKWSDGWLEQGGYWGGSGHTTYVMTFLYPFSSAAFSMIGQDVGGARASYAWAHDHGGVSVTLYVDTTEPRATYWYACGQGA